MVCNILSFSVNKSSLDFYHDRLNCASLAVIYLFPKLTKNAEKFQERVHYMPATCSLNPSNQKKKARSRRYTFRLQVNLFTVNIVYFEQHVKFVDIFVICWLETDLEKPFKDIESGIQYGTGVVFTSEGPKLMHFCIYGSVAKFGMPKSGMLNLPLRRKFIQSLSAQLSK